MPAVLSVIGCKHAGKTQLIELIVPLIKRAGCSVGTVKYAEWDRFDWERPGTETSRHILARSDVTAIFGRTAAAVRYANRRTKYCDLENLIKSFFQNVDVVFVEGLCAAGAKLEVWRQGYSDHAIATPDELVATYGDSLFSSAAPHFLPGCESSLARVILQSFHA